MTFLDFLAFIIYTFVFAWLFAKARKNLKDPRIRIIHRNAFWVKVIMCLSYSLFVLYIIGGDSVTLYFPEGYNFYRLILKDPSNLSLIVNSGSDVSPNILLNPDEAGYFTDSGVFMVVRLITILCFLSFGKYLVVSLFFAMIAFTGIWKLYLFFCDQYPQLFKQFAIAILFLPTFTFWSSGILKDPLAVSALGWFTWSLYEIAFYKRNFIKNGLIILICAYVFSVIKVYILVAYLPAFIVFLLFKNAMLVQNKLVKVSLVCFFIAGSIYGFIKLSSTMTNAVADYAGDDLTKGIVNYQKNYIRQGETAEGSYFSLGVDFDGTPGSLARMAPAAITATLFRPYLWESKKLSTLLSSLESLSLMLFTLFVLKKVGIKNFFLTIVRKPIVLYCFFFSIVFALFVGATTLNFGTLVRYKIPAMPFYVISLFLILFFNNKIKMAGEKVMAENNDGPATPAIPPGIL